MLPKRSSWSGLLLSSAVLATSFFAAPTPTFAQEAPAAPAAPAVDKKLVSLADDFLHYSIVGNDELARDTGQALLNANPSPRDLLLAFEAAANERDIPAILQRNQRRTPLTEVSKQIQSRLEEGHLAIARNPQRIKDEIERLDDSPRAYANARDRLTAAGPFAVPYYLQYLQDTKKAPLHPYIQKLIVEIGQPLLPPLLQELQTGNVGEKALLVNMIGQIGYPQAVPYLKAVAEEPNVAAPVKNAAEAAIARCDARGVYARLSAADAFLAMAQTLYQKDPVSAAPFANEPTNPVWFYDKGLDNVVSALVPTPIWSSVEVMRATERTLQADPNKSPATSLWIAANLRREILMPPGAKDPTRPENAPVAGFYAVAAGPVYLNPVLQMALASRDNGLVLKTIQALEATGGTQGLVSAKEGATPLVKALSYPDRAVRFSAAFALARANPAKDYPGSFRVVPVLVEAIAQTGAPSVLLINPDQEQRNRVKGILTQMSPAYNVYDGASISAALENAKKAAAFDAVIVPADNSIAQLRDFATTDYRLSTSPLVVLTDRPMADAGVTTLPANTDDKALTAALSAIRNQSSTPIDPAAATTYSMTAIKILGQLAGDHASIYNINDAVPALTDALKDKRPEVVTAVAGVLGQLNNADAQKALARAALGASDTAQQATLFATLAESAKRTGNALDAATIDKLIKVVAARESDPGVRSAAATALGALNVPSNQASTLILQQAR